jgi:hypothetical protein
MQWVASVLCNSKIELQGQLQNTPFFHSDSLTNFSTYPSFMHHGGNLKNNFHWNFVIDDDLCFNLTLCYEINANMNDIIVQQSIILITKPCHIFTIEEFGDMNKWKFGGPGEELDICLNMRRILQFQQLKGWWRGKFYILQYQWKRIMIHDSFQCVWGFWIWWWWLCSY